MEFCWHIFSKCLQKRQKKKKKIAYLSKYCLDVEDVYINLYVFLDAEACYEVIEDVRGHANVVTVKVKVMLTK